MPLLSLCHHVVWGFLGICFGKWRGVGPDDEGAAKAFVLSHVPVLVALIFLVFFVAFVYRLSSEECPCGILDYDPGSRLYRRPALPCCTLLSSPCLTSARRPGAPWWGPQGLCAGEGDAVARGGGRAALLDLACSSWLPVPHSHHSAGN